MQNRYFFATIFAKLDTPNDLFVNQIGGHRVVGGLMPRRKNFFPIEQAPRGAILPDALLFGVLFALTDGVGHVIGAAAQTRHLSMKKDIPSVNSVSQNKAEYQQIPNLKDGLKIPWPTIKCNLSKLDVILCSKKSAYLSLIKCSFFDILLLLFNDRLTADSPSFDSIFGSTASPINLKIMVQTAKAA
uniref:Uncharacterized protein n=1 Tax=Romanomermis culicivorax TaxID=13658 RepID=A0A915KRR8_ROMCU